MGFSLRCSARAPSVAASLAGEHRLSAQALAAAASGLSSCCSWALEHGLSSFATRVHMLQGMWSLPGPGIEPMSPAFQADVYLLYHQGRPQLTAHCLEALKFYDSLEQTIQ